MDTNGLSRLALILSGLFAATNSLAQINEATEIQFCSGVAAPYSDCAAAELRKQADALTSPVSIYEYVSNQYEFALYHGARGGSINTFLGGRGNDVDLAATLIAMLRARGVPARYAVGTVRVRSTIVANWLGVKNVELAYHLLRNQGIQNVVLSSDQSTIDFEHVWVEALIPYTDYRGARVASTSCVNTPAECNWTPLDPSFKQRIVRTSGLDPANTLAFDYTAYYNALLNNNDATRRDKNPLTIYEEQILTWLHTTAPGMTLVDVPDIGERITGVNGLLPASLPYTVIGSVRRYNSMADHDAVVPASEPKRWGKTLSMQIRLVIVTSGGGTITLNVGGGGPRLLTDLATKRLTLTTEIVGNIPNMVVRLDGVEIARPLSGGGNLGGYIPQVGDPFTIVVSMDGVPAADSAGTDQIISATYSAMVGGYYLLATGGESSNWSQVHRAAQQLLDANAQYPIVLNTAEAGCQPGGINCTPYVDQNGNGWDASDQRLLDNKPALDALSGGLLYVAGTQYYAKLREQFERADALNKIKTPIDGFLGVVSTTYDVEYIDGTAFSVLPGGLLIDMKGIFMGGSWEIDQPAAYSNSHFEFLGHIGSSLEHETWQELTGYDAISTVRGIQFAMTQQSTRGASATLLHPVKNPYATPAIDTVASSLNYSTNPSIDPDAVAYHNIVAQWINTQPAGTWSEAYVPSVLPAGDFNKFGVAIYKRFIPGTNSLASMTFEILNLGISAGGGYVDGAQTLRPAVAVLGSSTNGPTFNNATFTDRNTIAESNNDVIRTPSTADPISTVTGNNYHDETDIRIKGRGIHYAFTRTYNSTPSSTSVNGTLGYGWTHSYNMRLKSNDYGSCANCAPGNGADQRPENGNNLTSSITYTDERGGDHNYLVNESTYVINPPQGEFESLVLDAPVAGQHTLTFRNGTRYVFEGSSSIRTTPNVTARLRHISDPWGNQLNFGYDGNGRLWTVTDNLGISGRTGLVFAYDGAGKLSRITDWTNRQWNYVVNTSGDLQSYTNPLSQQTRYTYALGTHNLSAVIKPLQRGGKDVKVGFKYYENGRGFNQTDSFGVGDTLDYDLYRKSTRVTDARGHTRIYHYDDSGRMTKLIEPDGAVLLFNNSADGLRNRKTDGLGYATQYSYRTDFAFAGASNTFGNVTREQDALNNTIDTTYGIYDQVATIKDKRGTVRTTTFHPTTDSTCAAAGKPNRVTVSSLTVNGSTLTNVPLKDFCWYADGQIRTITEYIAPGITARYRRRSFIYTDNTHLHVMQIDETGSDGVVVSRSYWYDNLGRMTRETLPRRVSPTNSAAINLYTHYFYDELDRVWRTEDSLQNHMDTVFDANGQVYQIIGRYRQSNGSYVARTISTRTYDSNDRLIGNTDVYNNTTTLKYDPAGNLIASIDPYDRTTKYEYDAMNRRTAVIDASGNRTVTKYDLAGRVASVTNANGETVANGYDALGRLRQITDAMGGITQFGYDANGNLTCTIDANAYVGLQPRNTDNCTESRAYDELNRVLLVNHAPGGGITLYGYDLLGNTTSIRDAMLKTTTFGFDDLGRHVSTTDPLSRTTTLLRDQAGNVYQVTNRLNQVTQITYDYLNRVERKDYLTDGTAETFTYDSFGNRRTVSNNVVTYTFSYDDKNRLLRKHDSRANKTMSFGYDANDNLIMKTDFQGHSTDFQYDSANRLVAMSNPAYLKVIYQYDPAGRLSSRVLSNGARSIYAWDANGQIKFLGNYASNGQVQSGAQYSRDHVGNITSMTGFGMARGDYIYDAMYRLRVAAIQSAHPHFSSITTYDAVGNRLTHHVDGSSGTEYYEFYPSSNRLRYVRDGSPSGPILRSFTYDDEGRLIAQTGGSASGYPTSIAWDQKNRVRSMTSSLGSTTTFQYDPMNYRIGATGGSLGNRDYYLEGEHLEAEYSNGALKSKYFRGVTTDELVAAFHYENGQSTPSIYHHDHLNSVVGTSAHDGQIQQGFVYSPFGEHVSTPGATSRLRYTGREFDTDTNLYYYRARYYDPSIGRFLSEDSLGFDAGINFYAYVNNNPVNANDPSGLAAETPWDLFNVGMGSFSLAANLQQGNYGWAALDAAGLVYDGIATAVPFLPAGASAGISALRAGNTISNSAQIGLDVARTANIANDVARNTNATGNAMQIGQSIHREVGTILDQGNVLSGSANNFFRGANRATGPQADLSWGNTVSGSGLGVWADLTTPGQWTRHVSSYGARLGEGVPLLYQPGIGIVDTGTAITRLSSGASTAFTFGQQMFNNSASGAAGGFLLYPNKPNNNSVVSVYAK